MKKGNVSEFHKKKKNIQSFFSCLHSQHRKIISLPSCGFTQSLDFNLEAHKASLGVFKQPPTQDRAQSDPLRCVRRPRVPGPTTSCYSTTDGLRLRHGWSRRLFTVSVVTQAVFRNSG